MRKETFYIFLEWQQVVYSKQIQAIEKGEIHGKTLPQT